MNKQLLVFALLTGFFISAVSSFQASLYWIFPVSTIFLIPLLFWVGENKKYKIRYTFSVGVAILIILMLSPFYYAYATEDTSCLKNKMECSTKGYLYNSTIVYQFPSLKFGCTNNPIDATIVATSAIHNWKNECNFIWCRELFEKAFDFDKKSLEECKK